MRFEIELSILGMGFFVLRSVRGLNSRRSFNARLKMSKDDSGRCMAAHTAKGSLD